MDVENPKLAIPRVPKAVKHSDRHRHPRSSTSADDLTAERELSLSFEDIKRIHMVPVCVRLHAESRAEAGIDYLELRQLGEHAVVARTTRDPFSLVGADADACHRRSIATPSASPRRLALSLAAIGQSRAHEA
jgi:hypothetical protein